MNESLAIIDTGAANLAAVRACFNRLNVSFKTVKSPGEVGTVQAMVLPGVGAFDPVQRFLQAEGWFEYLNEWVSKDKALLAICLGFQLLCQSSEEGQECSGLGVLPGRVTSLYPESLGGIKPQLGWNQVLAYPGSELLETGYAYFANSFALRSIDTEWKPAQASLSGPFVAAVEKGNLLACQFHPELSGTYGQRLLTRWVERFQVNTLGEQTC